MKITVQIFSLIFMFGISVAQVPTLDLSFNTSGYGTITDNSSSEEATSIKIQSDGKIVLAGYKVNGTADHDVYLARLNADGTTDASFNIYTSHINTNSEFVDMVIQNDGKILCVGKTGTLSNSDMLVMRFNSNGLPDNTFDGDGSMILDLNGLNLDDQAASIKVKSDGKILIAGHSELRGRYNMFVIRLNSNGALDNTFSGSGYYYNQASLGNDFITNMDITSSGKILLSGAGIDTLGNYQFMAARVLANGGMDNSFGSSGVFLESIPGNINIARDIISLASGKTILVCNTSVGSTNSAMLMVMRLLENGTLDNDYGLFGVATYSSLPKYFVCENAVIASNDELIMEGYHMVSPSHIEIGVGRIDSTGVDVSGFGTNGFKWFSVAGGSNICHDIALQSDGKILLAGGYRNSSMTVGDMCAVRLGMNSTGIESLMDKLLIQCYPNPTQDKIFIESDKAIDKISVMNSLGEIIISQFVNHTKTSSVSLENLQKGVYILQVEADNKQSSYKIVKD